MVQAPHRPLSLEEFLPLPEVKPAHEYINGQILKNICHCLKHGTQMGWLIDPSEQTVFVYQPQRELEICDEPNTQLPTPGFAHGLGLTIGELFAWLLE